MASSRNWKIAIGVPWMALGYLLVQIGRSYDRLPERVASHFNAAGVANGWMGKQQFFVTTVLIAFSLLCTFTFLLSRFSQMSGVGWLLMVVEYFALGTIVMVTHGMLKIALGEAQTLDFPIGTWALVMGGALVVGETGRVAALRKGVDRDHGSFVWQERHGSSRVATILAGTSVAICAGAQFLHARGPALMIPAIVGFIILICAIWAYTGFVYRLSTNGLEIRMLGVPIRFTDAAQIASVNASGCNALKDFGGWGIRGIGSMRAYIWGGDQCVHIRTLAGEDIYLGSRDAQRLARELESLVPVKQV